MVNCITLKSLDWLQEWWLRGERRKEASRGISIYLYVNNISMMRYNEKGLKAKGSKGSRGMVIRLKAEGKRLETQGHRGTK